MWEGQAVNFSRNCLTTDLSSSTKHKEETEYSLDSFHKTKDQLSSRKAMSLRVPSASWTHSRAVQGALSEVALLAEEALCNGTVP